MHTRKLPFVITLRKFKIRLLLSVASRQIACKSLLEFISWLGRWDMHRIMQTLFKAHFVTWMYIHKPQRDWFKLAPKFVRGPHRLGSTERLWWVPSFLISNLPLFCLFLFLYFLYPPPAREGTRALLWVAVLEVRRNCVFFRL